MNKRRELTVAHTVAGLHGRDGGNRRLRGNQCIGRDCKLLSVQPHRVGETAAVGIHFGQSTGPQSAAGSCGFSDAYRTLKQ